MRIDCEEFAKIEGAARPVGETVVVHPVPDPFRPLVLVVEDEPEIAALMRDFLEASDFRVLLAGDAEEATGALGLAPDCVLLDVMLPGRSGFELCREIRAASELPVLFLSARDGDAEKIRGLGLGADDYIVKSATPAEVVARIKAVLRRSGADRGQRRLRFGRLEVDLAAHEVRVGRQAGAVDRPRVRAACGCSSSIRARCSAASICSSSCGEATATAAPSRSTSAGCARSSRTTRPIPTTSSPSGAPATGSTASPRARSRGMSRLRGSTPLALAVCVLALLALAAAASAAGYLLEAHRQRTDRDHRLAAAAAYVQHDKAQAETTGWHSLTEKLAALGLSAQLTMTFPTGKDRRSPHRIAGGSAVRTIRSTPVVAGSSTVEHSPSMVRTRRPAPRRRATPFPLVGAASALGLDLYAPPLDRTRELLVALASGLAALLLGGTLLSGRRAAGSSLRFAA